MCLRTIIPRYLKELLSRFVYNLNILRLQPYSLASVAP
jgi:hypothetical protein